jgi:hypothetical protein
LSRDQAQNSTRNGANCPKETEGSDEETMKLENRRLLGAVTLAAALAVPVRLAAQDGTAQANKPKHHHYQLIDLGTFGGPTSGLSRFHFPAVRPKD